MKFVSSLLKLIGVKWKAKQIRQGDKRLWQYVIDFQDLKNGERLAILNALARRFERVLDGQIVTDTRRYPPEKTTENQGSVSSHLNTPKTVDIPGLKPVTDEPNNLDKPDGISVTKFQPEVKPQTTFYPGQVVKHQNGGEKLRVVNLGDGGYCQVRGIFSGSIWHSHIDSLEVAS